ncbi:MAG TPA: response regulator [Polyangium sp.]|nr:response regulator [Polyangium sp.]
MRTWKPRQPVVLVVDDDPDILQLLGMCLAAEGCDVREALTEREALQRLDRVDVLIVDQRMPHTSGTDLVVKARAQGFGGRVLIISGSRDALVDARRTLADGFLAKPIGPRELSKEVERLFYLNVPMLVCSRPSRTDSGSDLDPRFAR